MHMKPLRPIYSPLAPNFLKALKAFNNGKSQPLLLYFDIGEGALLYFLGVPQLVN